MARSCGLRIGPKHFEMVVLDGGPKKHKITAYHMGVFPEGDEEEGHKEASRVLKQAASEFKIPRDNIGIAIDTGRAAFRRVKLPFTDRAKIEQVLKYEVESDLPQYNVDELVVDFHPLMESGDQTELLVSAVPKADLGQVIELCEGAGIEALEAELETTSIVNAASGAGLCNIDDAQLLVHVGEYSTSVVVMDAGEVREMRVIHIGALSHEATMAAEPPAADEEGEESTEDSQEPVAEPESTVDSFEVARRLEQTVKRIRRELGVTLSGARTIHPCDAIYVCGLELPGLIGSSVLDVPIYVLDCFDEDGGQPADGFGALVVSYGVALRRLGGAVVEGSLRREELRFTGTFERLEFPLAVTGLLLATLLGVVNILLTREGGWLEKIGLTSWAYYTTEFMVGAPAQGKPGWLDPVPDSLAAEAQHFKVQGEKDPDRTVVESLESMAQTLGSEILELRRTMGQTSEVQQPQSAFVATTLVLGVLENNPDWRVTLREVRGAFVPGQAGRGRPDSVKVTLDFVIHADNTLRATQSLEAFRRDLLGQSWIGPEGVAEPSNEPLENGRGIHIESLVVSVDVAKFEASKQEGA